MIEGTAEVLDCICRRLRFFSSLSPSLPPSLPPSFHPSLSYLAFVACTTVLKLEKGELLIYTAFSMLTYTPWGYIGNLTFILLGVIPNLDKKDK